ncbi:hypothetical protein ADIS_1953 [Lunatimonas lonarensis]|uniref:Uncharacterized protein n=1 Tax=Lunatimonas lonarensis TaxID=1232681 RepID=R7ZTU9_9BACT|nr:hypothetical protein ADIS_1953 [Lunatimonas lonarensis]
MGCTEIGQTTRIDPKHPESDGTAFKEKGTNPEEDQNQLSL